MKIIQDKTERQRWIVLARAEIVSYRTDGVMEACARPSRITDPLTISASLFFTRPHPHSHSRCLHVRSPLCIFTFTLTLLYVHLSKCQEKSIHNGSLFYIVFFLLFYNLTPHPYTATRIQFMLRNVSYCFVSLIHHSRS